MPLTKARPPVTAISEMLSGTTKITITSAGGPIDVNVGGADMVDLAGTNITVDDLVTLIAKLITGESIALATTAGAAMRVRTTATDGEVQTTSADDLILGSNSLNNLTCLTSGQVALGTVGSIGGNLIHKTYVDDLIAGVPDLTTDIDANMADPGHFKMPTNDGSNEFILNFGTNPSVGNNTVTTVTFDEAFPNSFIAGWCNSTTQANHDGTMSVISPTLTTMDIHSSLDKSSAFSWFAIGT